MLWLCCAAPPSPDPGRHAKDDRNADRAAQHIAQLGGLIDDLLHRQHRKVGELELVDRPHAGQRRADRDACSAEFRDRRIHDPLLAEAFDEIAGDLKGAAVDADVLAHQEHAARRVRARWRALRGSPRRRRVRDCSSRRALGGRIDVARQIRDRRPRARARGCDGLGHFLFDLGRDRRDARPGRKAERDDLRFEARDRVARLPGLDLFARTIAIAVGTGMTARAVGLGLDQRRTFPARARSVAWNEASATSAKLLPSTMTPGIA